MTTHEQPKARKHPVAIQSEVDKQVTALEAAKKLVADETAPRNRLIRQFWNLIPRWRD